MAWIEDGKDMINVCRWSKKNVLLGKFKFDENKIITLYLFAFLCKICAV